MGAWLRRNALRLAFAAGASWAVVGLFMEDLFAWVPDNAGRSAIEFAVVMMVALASVGITWMITRWRAGFLVPPAGLSAGFWITRALLIPILVWVLLAVVCGLMALVELRITGDPSDSQYGVSVAWAVVWYPVFLTPIVATVALWRAALR
ncbi:MAG TPA: hypothetical protein VEC56_07900 [Candidatus Krumholzibacteria bacterium]|nr:hypothetical protein [Candidatus Krumholzibacteria bacterium]